MHLCLYLPGAGVQQEVEHVVLIAFLALAQHALFKNTLLFRFKIETDGEIRDGEVVVHRALKFEVIVHPVEQKSVVFNATPALHSAEQHPVGSIAAVVSGITSIE